ncbi:hypothetical protein Tco_1379771 [Tanacetum coccineum]
MDNSIWGCIATSVESNNWSDVLSLYFWRAKEADRRLARMINNVSVKLRAAIEERADEKLLFIEKLKGNVPFE